MAIIILYPSDFKSPSLWEYILDQLKFPDNTTELELLVPEASCFDDNGDFIEAYPPKEPQE